MKKPIAEGNWILVNKDGKQVYYGDRAWEKQGVKYVVGGTPPATEGGLGNVHLEDGYTGIIGVFTPGPCKMEWYLISGKGKS